MDRAFVRLMVVFGALLTVNCDMGFDEMEDITDETPFEDLPEDMKTYVKEIFQAKKKLDEMHDGDIVSRFHRCLYRLVVDEKALMYLLKRWSSLEVKIPTKSGTMLRVDMAHNWYMIPTSQIVYSIFCAFSPHRLRENTIK